MTNVPECNCCCGLCFTGASVYNHCSACRVGLWRDSIVRPDEYVNAVAMWKLIHQRTRERGQAHGNG